MVSIAHGHYSLMLIKLSKFFANAHQAKQCSQAHQAKASPTLKT